ncbi:MAG TPA: DUF4118 domain-containing protein [Acidimicrobiales bacterium]|nr:DUF4118 domain-containing protein [Acidimicrobiales bacterium]
MRALRYSWARVVLAGSIPIVVSTAWVPLREKLPNTDLALVLVLVIATIGWLAGPKASFISAVSAAGAFDVLDTRPYGALTMSRGIDVTTALILLLTGFLIGVGAARLGRYQRSEGYRADAFNVVMEASGLVATGEEQQLITEALSAELLQVLELADCQLHMTPPSGRRPSVARDGSLVGLLVRGTPTDIDLPVWSQGDVVAHYRLTLGPKRLSREELRVALSLADQAGAAMANTDRDPPPRPQSLGRLRLFRSAGQSEPAGASRTEGARPASRKRKPRAKALRTAG